jgi:hypothetical protein
MKRRHCKRDATGGCATGRLFEARHTEQGVYYRYPSSRCDDPATSRIAAEQHEASGKAQLHREIILRALAKRDGQTGHELGLSTGLGQVECCRRLAELAADGVIEPLDATLPCSVKPKSKQRRWYLVT